VIIYNIMCNIIYLIKHKQNLERNHHITIKDGGFLFWISPHYLVSLYFNPSIHPSSSIPAAANCRTVALITIIDAPPPPHTHTHTCNRFISALGSIRKLFTDVFNLHETCLNKHLKVKSGLSRSLIPSWLKYVSTRFRGKQAARERACVCF